MPDHFAQLALTRYAAPDERLRLAFADHALGRMTAAAWAELAQELMAGRPPSEKSGPNRILAIIDERDAARKDRRLARKSLADVFAWLRANPKASCADAVEHLSEHDPE